MDDRIVVSIEVETRHNFKYVVVRVMRREFKVENGPVFIGDVSGRLADHPLNISPTYAEDLPFASLELSGSFSSIDGKLTGLYPIYHDAYAVDLRQATAMAKMLAKIEKARAKAEASEPGDIFMAFCKAVGAKEIAVCLTPPGHPDRNWLTRCRWSWDTVETGRNRLRNLIMIEENVAA